MMEAVPGHMAVGSSRRRRARDAKLMAREEIIADARGDRKRACPCNVCISGDRDILLRRTVRNHVELYGRHPFNRGSTEVGLFFETCIYSY